MEKMTDIYDIQPILLDNFIDYKITLFYVILSLVLLAIVYYFILNNKKQEILEEKIGKQDIDFKERLSNIDINLGKDKFYSEVLGVLKDYLEYKTGKNISKMTLEELKNQNFNKKFYKLISDLYYKEYSNLIDSDTIEQRKQLINNLRKIIK